MKKISLLKKEEQKQKRNKIVIVRELKNLLLDLIYPPRCAICDRILKSKEKYCCTVCRGKLPRTGKTVCMKCGKPVALEQQEFCPDCVKYPHYFDQGTAPFTYSGEIRHSVYRMKHENRRDYLEFYAAAMADACKKYLNFWSPDLIIAVPMNRKRKRMRGYNQSAVLAERISEILGIPYAENALYCVRVTGEQKVLGRKERMKNLRGSFKVKSDLAGVKNVLLVDDVYTTGSTLDEMSRTLKNEGVKRVFFVVLCTGKGKKAVPII